MAISKADALDVLRAILSFLDSDLSFAESKAFLTQYSLTDAELGELLVNLALQGKRNANSLNLLWETFGAERVCRVCNDKYLLDPEVRRLMIHKLESEPNSFTEDMLEKVDKRFNDCRVFIEEIRRNRLRQKSRALLSQPREINTDTKAVHDNLSKYGFGQDLNPLLDKVDLELGTATDAFDDAATLKHVRTFLEKLHTRCVSTLREKCPETQFKVGNPNSEDKTPLDKHQHVIDFLERHGVLTIKMKKLSEALYGILSNEGVHAITARREYVRLCRNMVIEYALVLFHEMDRRIQSPAP